MGVSLEERNVLEINKVHCGDCLELMKQIPDKSVDMILCDLPYQKTGCDWDVIIPFDKLWKQYDRIKKDKCPVVLFGTESFSSLMRVSNLKEFKYDWIWHKKQCGNLFLAKRQPLKTFETISVFYKHNYYPQMTKGKMRKKGGGNHNKIFGNTDASYNDLYYPVAILEFANCSKKSDKLHPTQKPVALFEYLIKTYTNEGDLVLDNCAGSGTTGVACKNLNRNFILIEKEEKYCEIARRRIDEIK